MNRLIFFMHFLSLLTIEVFASLPERPPLPTNMSPALTRFLLTVMVLPVLFGAIAGCLSHFSKRYLHSLHLLYAQAIALYASYLVCWLAGFILWIFAYVKASFDFGEAGFAVLLIVCSVSYLTESVSSRLRQLLWRIPDFNRLQRREVDSLVPTFRALLYLSINEHASSTFPFDQRLALVMIALEKGHKRMLEILCRSTGTSVNCSHNLRELQQWLSGFDGLPDSVQPLVPHALASLVQLAIEKDHSHTLTFRDLVEWVHFSLKLGDEELLKTFICLYRSPYEYEYGYSTVCEPHNLLKLQERLQNLSCLPEVGLQRLPKTIKALLQHGSGRYASTPVPYEVQVELAMLYLKFGEVDVSPVMNHIRIDPDNGIEAKWLREWRAQFQGCLSADDSDWRPDCSPVTPPTTEDVSNAPDIDVLAPRARELHEQQGVQFVMLVYGMIRPQGFLWADLQQSLREYKIVLQADCKETFRRVVAQYSNTAALRVPN